MPSRSVSAHVDAWGGAEVLRIDDAPVEAPGAGQVLVRVTAAGVNGLDWAVREGFVRDACPLALRATLGVELAGVVVRRGRHTTRFAVGDRVFGALGGLGAYAGFVVSERVIAATQKPIHGSAFAATIQAVAISKCGSSAAERHCLPRRSAPP